MPRLPPARRLRAATRAPTRRHQATRTHLSRPPPTSPLPPGARHFRPSRPGARPVRRTSAPARRPLGCLPGSHRLGCFLGKDRRKNQGQMFKRKKEKKKRDWPVWGPLNKEPSLKMCSSGSSNSSLSFTHSFNVDCLVPWVPAELGYGEQDDE